MSLLHTQTSLPTGSVSCKTYAVCLAIHKIESTNAFMLCHHFDHIHPVQLLICDTCGFVKELHSTVISHELNNLAAEGGFVVSGQTIEAHGKCESCRVS